MVFGIVVYCNASRVVAHPTLAVLAPFVALGDPELRRNQNHTLSHLPSLQECRTMDETWVSYHIFFFIFIITPAPEFGTSDQRPLAFSPLK